MMLVKKNRAFTLIELLVVMAILILMIIILIGILNPIALVNKARDSRRKKDLRRIGIAFEEYFNDKGCYPNDSSPDYLLSYLMEKDSCDSSSIFGKWLKPWPCDPSGSPYKIEVGYDLECPKWFRISAILENKSDAAINMAGVLSTDYNYAVTSGNITPGFYPGDENPDCLTGMCFRFTFGGTQCNSIGGAQGCEGPNCFTRPGCPSECRVSCCGGGCP